MTGEPTRFSRWGNRISWLLVPLAAVMQFVWLRRPVSIAGVTMTLELPLFGFLALIAAPWAVARIRVMTRWVQVLAGAFTVLIVYAMVGIAWRASPVVETSHLTVVPGSYLLVPLLTALLAMAAEHAPVMTPAPPHHWRPAGLSTTVERGAGSDGRKGDHAAPSVSCPVPSHRPSRALLTAPTPRPRSPFAPRVRLAPRPTVPTSLLCSHRELPPIVPISLLLPTSLLCSHPGHNPGVDQKARCEPMDEARTDGRCGNRTGSERGTNSWNCRENQPALPGNPPIPCRKTQPAPCREPPFIPMMRTA